MKTFCIITIFSLSLFSCAQETVRGNGNRITENRTINSNFNEVESAGAFDVIINEGPQNGKIKLEGDSNVLDKIEIELEGNTLVLRQKQGYNFFTNPGKVTITFQAKNLRSIGLSGSGTIIAHGTQTVEDFTVALSGSGDIDAKVSARNITSALSGSGNINLEGNSTTFKAGISGSGDIGGYDLKTKNADIGISGSGNVKITANGDLTGAIGGSGDIYYKGNPSKVNVTSGGSGDIIDAN
ncbi:head GIN domain-containing protein [Moheibacter lacus]|uniref:DUF2807 domain-containing protein n=1 Tax=Moheibacter lacus TaxID=2745851 RepID=A0A838ZJJ3_9FLAO|nr:head GIN domain-containing protein [Moheibacter lacus]MBA5629811.1 DUF2807 domain-containing protein [Moheibacter lacus]